MLAGCLGSFFVCFALFSVSLIQIWIIRKEETSTGKQFIRLGCRQVCGGASSIRDTGKSQVRVPNPLWVLPSLGMQA